jgi:protein-S-isoprenylcysteine O-methyltransferase Ste14
MRSLRRLAKSTALLSWRPRYNDRRSSAAMKATEFEVRHQTLLHFLLVTAAFLSYLLQPDDMVWAFVKDSVQNRLLERSLFAVAALLMGVGAGICTWARVYSETDLSGISARSRIAGPYRYVRYPQQLGNFLFAVGLGSLAPLGGFLILVAGQALLIFRLIRRAETSTPAGDSLVPQPPVANWSQAVREQAGKWGLFLTMIIFTILLVDRVAEIFAVASALVWLLLNLPHFNRFPEHR